MRIHLTSVYVDDQDKALPFYNEVLGFAKQEDFPVRDHGRARGHVRKPDRDRAPERDLT